MYISHSKFLDNHPCLNCDSNFLYMHDWLVLSHLFIIYQWAAKVSTFDLLVELGPTSLVANVAVCGEHVLHWLSCHDLITFSISWTPGYHRFYIIT